MVWWTKLCLKDPGMNTSCLQMQFSTCIKHNWSQPLGVVARIRKVCNIPSGSE